MTRLVLLLPLLVGCPKNDAIQDAGVTTTVTSAAPTASMATLAPIDDLGTPAASVTATAQNAPPLALHPSTATTAMPTLGGAVVKPPASAAVTAPAQASLATKLQACCGALRKQAQQPSAQAAQYAQAAGICDGLVAAMGSGAGPQIEQLKPLLQGAQLPPLCQGL
jgi:hypothetical protein